MTMALSVIEVEEEDCNTYYGFNIKILNKSHAKSLLNRYYKINMSDDWTIFDENDINRFIGQTLIFRSPITCFTPNYKICKKCFGDYKRIKTPYLGIIAGQVN
jgi:hypothetical protein